jgi:hypothetical protein
MTWPALQKAVSDALKLEELGVSVETTENKPVSEKPKLVSNKPELTAEQKAALPYMDKTIVISPELAPERYRLLKYDEEVGGDYEVTERKFDMDSNDNVFDVSGDLGNRESIDKYHDYLTGTYRLQKKSDRKTIAMSSVPKENSGMMQRWQDVVTLVTWQGRVGYLWKHMWLPNVKDLLMKSGHYNEYKDLFVGEPNVWYAAGKQLVCDPHLVHRVLHEIEEKEQRAMREGRSAGWSW